MLKPDRDREIMCRYRAGEALTALAVAYGVRKRRIQEIILAGNEKQTTLQRKEASKRNLQAEIIAARNEACTVPPYKGSAGWPT